MKGIRTYYGSIILSFMLFFNVDQAFTQFSYENEIYVTGDVIEMRISIIEFGNHADTTQLFFLKENESNSLVCDEKDLDKNEWKYVYDINSQSVTRTCVINGDTSIRTTIVNLPPITQRVCLASKQLKDEQGRIVLECYDSLCNNKTEWTYWENNKIKSRTILFFDHTDHHKIEEKFDSIGNQIYSSRTNNDNTYSEFVGRYISGTNLPQFFFYKNVFSDSIILDTIQFQYDFDKKSNWINRKTFLNGLIEEDVLRKIFYASETKRIRMDNFRTKYNNNRCLISIDAVFKDYKLDYDCNNNILNCLSNDNKAKWSINTKKFPDQTITRIFVSNERKYDLIVWLQNNGYIKLNSRNGNFKIVRE